MAGMNKVNTQDSGEQANPITRQIYRDLPAGMYAEATMFVSPAPSLLKLNQALLADMTLSSAWFKSEDGLSALSGKAVNSNNSPIALAYSGHQFGHWVPVLGDGRAHMLGQIVQGDGAPIDIQTKGSGRTAYSRGGDGRATLGSVLREYIVSEAMAGLGIPTTRSLAAIATGETVMREAPAQGAILVRTASSHLRVGSFQFASASPDSGDVRKLADFTIEHYFSELKHQPDRYYSRY